MDEQVVIAEKANQEEKARQAILEKNLNDAEKKLEEKQRVHREYMTDAAAKLGNTTHPLMPYCVVTSFFHRLLISHPNYALATYLTVPHITPAAEKQTTKASQELEVTLQSEINERNLALTRAKERNITVSVGDYHPVSLIAQCLANSPRFF